MIDRGKDVLSVGGRLRKSFLGVGEPTFVPNTRSK